MLEKLASKKPRSAEFVLVLDEQAVDEYEQARAAVGMAELMARQPDGSTGADPAIALAKDRLAGAEAAYRDAVFALRFEALARHEYAALLAANPPTAEQKARDEDYNVDKFAPALCAACSLDGLESEDFVRLWHGDKAAGNKGWNEAEVAKCYQTALAVCTQSRNAALPKG